MDNGESEFYLFGNGRKESASSNPYCIQPSCFGKGGKAAFAREHGECLAILYVSSPSQVIVLPAIEALRGSDSTNSYPVQAEMPTAAPR